VNITLPFILLVEVPNSPYPVLSPSPLSTVYPFVPKHSKLEKIRIASI